MQQIATAPIPHSPFYIRGTPTKLLTVATEDCFHEYSREVNMCNGSCSQLSRQITDLNPRYIEGVVVHAITMMVSRRH
jgi:hypothetical protein